MRDTNSQRSRIGRELCRRLLSEAAARTEVSGLSLNVYRDNPAAIALYIGLGFVAAAAGGARQGKTSGSWFCN